MSASKSTLVTELSKMFAACIIDNFSELLPVVDKPITLAIEVGICVCIFIANPACLASLQASSMSNFIVGFSNAIASPLKIDHSLRINPPIDVLY